MTIGTLLITTDGSDLAEAAAHRGLDLAKQLDATVHLLSVADSTLVTSASYVGESPRIQKRLRDDAETYVSRLESRIQEQNIEIETAVREGIPAEEILKYAAEYDVDTIVSGTAGRGTATRAVVGSVTDKVVRRARASVITINRQALESADEYSVDSILLPTDGSEPAEVGAERGIDLAEQLDATVHLFSVADEDVANGLDSLLGDPEVESLEELREQASEHLGRIATIASERDVNFLSATTISDPEEEIVDYVTENGIDLVVMGTHGRGGFQRFLLGSVTDAVIRRASVPVMSILSGGNNDVESGESK